MLRAELGIPRTAYKSKVSRVDQVTPGHPPKCRSKAVFDSPSTAGTTAGTEENHGTCSVRSHSPPNFGVPYCALLMEPMCRPNAGAIGCGASNMRCARERSLKRPSNGVERPSTSELHECLECTMRTHVNQGGLTCFTGLWPKKQAKTTGIHLGQKLGLQK